MKKIIFNWGKTVMYVFFLFILICCEKKENNEKVNILKKTIENSLGKKLSIPINLQSYTPFPQYIADSTELSHADLKLYTQINTSCSTCLEEINTWNKFIPKLMEYKVPVILICQSKDNFELLKYLCENGKIKKFSFPFFLDIKKEYISKNSFMDTSTEFETVLTDSKNKILLMGNPIHSEKTKSIYLNEIRKLTKELEKSNKQPIIYVGHK